MTARALVVGAPSSGSGKTTVATGLMAALRRRGTVVAPFKVGPDYIDPGYHTLAAGRPGRNLDPVLVGEDRIAPLARHGAAGAQVAVVEGVMGLFDGRLADGAGSTAHVAGLLGAPVVLVVDVRGQSRSLAAVLHGFRSFDPGVRVAGVVLNRVGSPRHEDVLRAAAEEVGLPVLGALPRRDALAVPSRHLGLVTAAEHGAAAHGAVDAMADLVAAHVDLDAVLALATPLPAGPVWDPVTEIGGLADGERGTRGRRTGDSRVVGVFGGAAFTFGYAEHVELLAAAGAEVVVVDPLREEALPPGTGALVVPGGFPEEHAAALGANAALRAAVRELAASGVPVHAECAGLLYLCASLDGAPMCGVLPATAAMTDRLTLGYRDAVAPGGSVLWAAGERVTGHEFHRCAVAPRAGADPAWVWRGAEPEGWLVGGVHASFLHTHPAGDPAAVGRFVSRSLSVGATVE
ncbi:cobyrinate a,c-diamide synthase [Pseudonocardia hydrocarbonoxydans]|uniref:Hydrogenobyrinate a,c-diamide synthase n=1 Tax=Pseudonocardia hydrocarbonoxydans TaxID=76726 RepID=A0A4Y3WV74_9PSEU|nr:cobyrinate a,c-diamide synthase [Pseudonocardia hydrocarbonoxydans]GEC21639.1 hydrogenobyrinate a,c-diamide synthase [Pseudonocardia hydrocarbonoxydans]